MPSGKIKILIVDDSRTVRQLLRLLISRHFPCDITDAEDGVVAVESLSVRRFDLVITDINMPRMDGLSLVSKIREELRLKVPIVIVTTVGKEADRDAGLKLGADSYLTKPIKGTDLVRTVLSLTN